MGTVKALADLAEHVDRPLHREGAAAADHPLEVDALHELHGHEGPALVLAGLDHVHQVRVGQVARELGFAAEALALGGSGAELLRHDLEGHAPAPGGVARLVDGRGRPAAEDTSQLEAADQFHVLTEMPFPPGL